MLYLEQVFRISATFSFGPISLVGIYKGAYYLLGSIYTRQCFIQGPVAVRPVFVQLRSNLDRFELRTAY